MVENRKWGRWTLDTTEPKALIIRATPWCDYDIVLSRCQTIEQQAHWLSHMSEKNWITAKDLGDLRQAFVELSQAKEELKAGAGGFS